MKADLLKLAAVALALPIMGCAQPTICEDGVLYTDADEDGIHVEAKTFGQNQKCFVPARAESEGTQ